jgi:putative FmdB family regulatory protein
MACNLESQERILSSRETCSVPLYEYQCKACKHKFERIQKFSDPPPTKCPECGKTKIQQMMSAPAVQFKGSGFYVTDYGKKPSSEGSSGKGSDIKAESKSESKPAKKTDSKSKE